MHALVRDETITIILITLSYEGLYFVEILDLNVKNETNHGKSD